MLLACLFAWHARRCRWRRFWRDIESSLTCLRVSLLEPEDAFRVFTCLTCQALADVSARMLVDRRVSNITAPHDL